MAGHIRRSAYEKGTGVHPTVVVLNIFPKHFVWICQKPILMLELLFVVLDFKSGSIVPVFLPVTNGREGYNASILTAHQYSHLCEQLVSNSVNNRVYDAQS